MTTLEKRKNKRQKMEKRAFEIMRYDMENLHLTDAAIWKAIKDVDDLTLANFIVNEGEYDD